MTWKLPVLCWMVLLAAALGARAQEEPLPDAGFTLRADVLSREGADTLYAIGNVYMQRGESIVTADAAVVWLADSEAYLEGHVVYRVGLSVIKAENAYVHWSETTDPETDKSATNITRGFLFHGDIRWRERPDGVPWHVRGDEVVQTDVRTFLVRGHAFFSSNLNHQPHTYFRAREIRLVGDESFESTHVTYHIQGVGLPPSLQGWWVPPTYWPKVYVPLGWEMPEMKFEFGSSSRWGTYLRTLVTYEMPPDFIPLVESQVGIRFDNMTKRGHAYGGIFKYWAEDALAGKLDYYRVPSDDGLDRKRYELGTTDRWRLKYAHSQDMPEGWEFDFEYQHYSDAGFQQEYFSDEYKSDKPIENRAYLKYSDGPYAAYAHYRWREMGWLDTTEYLPQIGLNVFSYPLWGNLLYTGHIELANIRRRLSDLRLPHCYQFIDPDPTDAEIADALGLDEVAEEDEEAYEEWQDQIDEGRDRVVIFREPGEIRDRDDIADSDYRRRALHRNYIHRPLRNWYQEDLSDGRRFWRLDTYHELALPFTAGIFQFDPYVGIRLTGYEETLMGGSTDWRTILVGGFRVATQFWRAWDDAHADSLRLFGTRIMPLQVNGLRHIVTPEIRFLALGVSSVKPNDLILTDDTDLQQPIANPDFTVAARPYQPVDTTGLAFGDIDYIHPVTGVSFGLRNRWQTRRDERIVDLVDLDLFLDIFRHRDRDLLLDDDCPEIGEDEDEDEEELIIIGEEDRYGDRRFGDGEGFADLRMDFRFSPVDGIHFFADGVYSITNDDAPSDGQIAKFNTGLLLATSDRWSLFLSQRYEVDDENRLGAALAYNVSKKWRIYAGYTYRTNNTEPLDLQFRILRDLHDWVAEFIIEDDREEAEKFFGFNVRPKMIRHLVSDIEYSRDLTAGAEPFREEQYQSYDY